MTNESRNLVDGFIEKTGATHPIVIESSDSASSFGIGGFPSSYLIGPDGKIVWSGHPASLPEAKIQELLKQVRLRPELPKSLSSIEKDLEKGAYGDARKGIERKLERLEGDEKKAAEEMIGWLDWKAKTLWDGAQASIDSGDIYDAWLALTELEECFDGTETGDRAKDTRKELEKDSAKKREIDAGEALAKTRDRARDMKPERAAAMFRALARKYDGTKVAAKAEALATEYEKKK